jgi:NADH dehydrogenase
MTTIQPGSLVTVFGGSGFVGRHVVRALARAGYRVRAACRRPDLAGYLQPMGNVGQITAVQANVRKEYRWSVERAVEGADAVVNLVGILAEGGRQSFANVQQRGAETVAEVVKSAGIANFVHVSAIGADAASASAYARSKAAGEAAVLANVPEAVILRPSIIFGPEDGFFNLLAGMVRMAPVVPVIGGGATKFQPVYAEDVGNAVLAGIEGRAKAGTIYELGGPDQVSFRQCIERVMEVTGHRRALMPLPFGLASFIAGLTDFIPGAPITRDQVELLKSDNLVSAAAVAEGRTLAGLGIEPATLASILPGYLWRYRAQGQFSHLATPKS